MYVGVSIYGKFDAVFYIYTFNKIYFYFYISSFFFFELVLEELLNLNANTRDI